MQEHKEETEFLDELVSEHSHLKELDDAFNNMYKARMYKQMMPLLEQVRETAPNIYASYIEIVRRAYQHQQKQERMMQ